MGRPHLNISVTAATGPHKYAPASTDLQLSTFFLYKSQLEVGQIPEWVGWPEIAWTASQSHCPLQRHPGKLLLKRIHHMPVDDRSWNI